MQVKLDYQRKSPSTDTARGMCSKATCDCCYLLTGPCLSEEEYFCALVSVLDSADAAVSQTAKIPV